MTPRDEFSYPSTVEDVVLAGDRDHRLADRRLLERRKPDPAVLESSAASAIDQQHRHPDLCCPHDWCGGPPPLRHRARRPAAPSRLDGHAGWVQPPGIRNALPADDRRERVGLRRDAIGQVAPVAEADEDYSAVVDA